MNSAYDLIEQPIQHGAVIYAEAGKVRVRGASKLPLPLLEQLKERRDDVLAVLTVPRLAWQLERHVIVACNGLLLVSVRGVPNASRYVRACRYLASSQKEEALKRLWEV